MKATKAHGHVSRLCQGLSAVAITVLQSAFPAAADTAPSDPQKKEAAIFAAAEKGDVATLKQLIGSGVDVDLRDGTGQTPLLAAALARQDEIARVLIEAHADVKARTSKGMTALHAAAYVGDVEIAEMLVAHGADINDQANIAGITPLFAAAEENHPDVVKALIKDGADVARLEVNGYTAGSRAGWREHWDVLRILLRSGDTCQPEAVAGKWLYEKCTNLDLSASN